MLVSGCDIWLAGIVGMMRVRPTTNTSVFLGCTASESTMASVPSLFRLNLQDFDLESSSPRYMSSFSDELLTSSPLEILF